MSVSNNATLSSELILKICSLLDLKSLVCASKSYKSLYHLLNANNICVNEIWKSYFDKICQDIPPKDRSLKSFLIEKIVCLKSPKDTYLDIGNSRLILSRIGLCTLKSVFFCAVQQIQLEMVEGMSDLTGELFVSLGKEYVQKNEIKNAEDLLICFSSEYKHYNLLAMEIIEHYIKLKDLRSALFRLKSMNFLDDIIYTALNLLIWNAAHANRCDIGIDALSYIFENYDLHLNDLKDCIAKSSAGACARYLYNFFVEKKTDAHIHGDSSIWDLKFYLDNDCLVEAEEIAHSFKKPQEQLSGLKAVCNEQIKRKNEQEVSRLLALIANVEKLINE